MAEPLVSVIIPAFKSAKYLKEALGSIVNQTYKNLEIFIIDDTPEDDGTEKIIADFNDIRVHHIKPEQRLGLVKSLNYGIELSNGEYIARMDADDISHVERIERQVKYLESHPDIGMVGSSIYFINEESKITGIYNCPETDPEIKTKLCFNSAFLHPAVILRSHILKQNLYCEDCFCAEDYELWTRLMPLIKFYNFPQRLLKYRRFNSSGSLDRSQQEKLAKDDKYYEKWLGVQKIIYGNVESYLDIKLLDIDSDGLELVAAKRTDKFSMGKKKRFLKQYSHYIMAKVGTMPYSEHCFAYQWLKMTKSYFWKCGDPKLVVLCLGEALRFKKNQMVRTNDSDTQEYKWQL